MSATPSPPATPSNELYARTRDEFIELIRSLTPEQLGTTVPLAPEWTVQDTVAHVCGINADILGQRLDGLGTDAWTAHQVDVRADKTAHEICDEWSSYGSDLDQLLAADAFLGVRITGDLIVHIHDVQHALGLPIDQESEATVVGAHRYVPHLQDRVAERMGVGVEVELTDGSSWPAPEGTTRDLTLRATPYDYLRSVTGRRSRRQVEALDWTGDPTAVLDRAWAAYGPLRETDVSV